MMLHNTYVCIYICCIGPAYDYYLGFFTNRHDDGGRISILLSTSATQPVEYSLDAPGVRTRSGTVSAGNEIILDLPENVEVTSDADDQQKGIYLTTSDKITVIGQNQDTHSSDTFFALPIIKLDDPYVYYGVSVPRARSPLARDFESSILIVGTENSTTVKVTTTQSVSHPMVGNLMPGTEHSFMINRLQTFFMGSVEDLSGTKIVTDRPVSVLSGHQCARIPFTRGRCSHLIEQIPPTELWGKVHYIAPLAAAQKGAYYIKIVAAYNSTIVNMYCNDAVESYIINEGQFIYEESRNEYCAIYSNKDVLVAQFSRGGGSGPNRPDREYGDPMMILVPAVNQYLNTFEFPTFQSQLSGREFDHYVNIIVMEQYFQPNMIYLTVGGANRSLDTQKWVPIRVNNTIEAYATQINISRGTARIFHANVEAQMMTFVYGFDPEYDGYGHFGGIHIAQGYYVNYLSVYIRQLHCTRNLVGVYKYL